MYRYNICDLLRFFTVTHFAICFDSKLYGCPKFLDRIETNNESVKMLLWKYIIKK